MAQSLTVRLADDPAAALALLKPAEAWAVHGETVHELAAGEAVFELYAGERLVGAFTLGRVGDALHCGAAAGEGGFDLTGTMHRFAEHEARRTGARRLVCETVRPGLVRKLKGQGYRVAYLLTKEL